ncbi:hypothetical protein ACFPIJ_58805 [Dactylosporangium cerinum]|uniref:Aminotransferase n=1 Tax=Dactylosporangium cerinum TaxID=1434730 RepID=A0ABV9WFV8_9ACTN
MGQFVLAGEAGGERLDDPGRRQRYLRYLRAGAPVGGGYRTDGHWIWAPALAERLEREHLLPEPPFAGHILRYGFMCPPVTTATADQARAALAQLLRG